MQDITLQYASLDYLKDIDGVHFTHREVDIIACLLSARGTSKIASLLSLSPKTVANHIRNIMVKIGCHSRESIIDFVEKNQKTIILRNHYASLALQAAFEKSLKDIRKLNTKVFHTLKIIVLSLEKAIKPIVDELLIHLKLVGLHVSLEHKALYTHTAHTGAQQEIAIYLWSKIENKEQQSHQIVCFMENTLLSHKDGTVLPFFILQEKLKEGTTYPRAFEHRTLVLEEAENYYFFFLNLLQQLDPTQQLQSPMDDFKLQYERLKSISEKKILLKEHEIDHSKQECNLPTKFQGIYAYARKHYLFIIGFILIGSSLSFLLPKSSKEGTHTLSSFFSNARHGNSVFRSNLPLSSKFTILKRSNLIAEIEEGFQNQQDIKTLVISGVGGAGKTTIARQYASLQKSSITWEINAETNDSLAYSFESLAYALARNDEDKKHLKSLQEIKSPQERINKLLFFVQIHLKIHPNWILIFDNVDSFTDIKSYLPNDAKVWGDGKIIITTRDSNIQYNGNIKYCLHIGGLAPKQKEELFTNIVLDKKILKTYPKLTSFLTNIPPYPLDVSLAAYYIKATGISYDKYLEALKENNNLFKNLQKRIIQDASDYNKTRYDIIGLSLKKLIEIGNNSADLLLLISLLDSQNIPINLLNEYQDPFIVDNLIYSLKKYSLITPDLANNTFSIHRSTQELTFSYLRSIFPLENNLSLMGPLVYAINKYIDGIIDQEDYIKMKSIITHTHHFLTHSDLLPINLKSSLEWRLGVLYYYLGDYPKAQGLLEENLSSNTVDAKTRFLILTYLGIVYRELGLYDKAINTLESGLSLYKKYSLANPLSLSMSLQNLGMSYREKGNYVAAKTALEESLKVFKTNKLNHPYKVAKILGYLGIVYGLLGDYKKSQEYLENSLLIYKRDTGNKIGVAWATTHLGNIYRSLGHYEKSKECFETGIKVYKEVFPEDYHRTIWCLAHLGIVLSEQGNYTEAKDIFNKILHQYMLKFGKDHPKIAWISLQLGRTYRMEGKLNQAEALLKSSLPIYQKGYGENNTETAQFLYELGFVFFAKNDLKNAAQYIEKALQIYSANKHPESYVCLEALSELFLKKSLQAIKMRDKHKSQKYKEQSLVYLRQALEIVKTHFPENSLHTIRIQEKLQLLNISS